MTSIKETLQDSNPWWLKEFKITFKDRVIYTKIQKFLPLPQIISLTGLRRVGKTTIMLKIAKDYISNNFPAQNIIYFSFDNFKEINVKDVLNEYSNIFDQKDIKQEKYLLLLDEIQKLDDWQNQIKSIYDAFKNIKIIISGSESLFIRKHSKETLAGRIYEFKVDTLNFKEYLLFKDINLMPINLHERELSKSFNKFILTQGFPELVNIDDKEIISKYIKENIIEKVLYTEMAKFFKIKDISILASLLNIFIEEPGQIIDIIDLAKELQISRQTISKYLSYLEDSFLLKKLYNYSKNRRKIERKMKKYYPVVISPNQIFKEDDLSKSKVFEWIVITQLNAEFFWRDSYKNEVDAILTSNKVIPVEIKYGKLNYEGLVSFMNKFKLNEAILISSNKEEIQNIDDKKITIIPAFKYFLKSE